MSDISVLSHEYKAATELSQTLNRSLIVLKKAYYKLPGAEAIAQEELEQSLQCLADIAGAIIRLLDPVRTANDRTACGGPVPAALVARIRAQRQGDLAYFVDDLEKAKRRLGQGLSQLSRTDISLLDQLAAAADAETSDVFRRLMRK